MLMLPAPVHLEPRPEREPPPGMKWWAWYGRVGDWIVERDGSGMVVKKWCRTKRIGYVLG